MLAIGGSDSNGALFSFSFAAIFLFIVLCMFYYATKQDFYQYYSALKPGEGDNKESVDFRQVLRCTWTFNVAAFLNFFVTLGVYPTYFRYKLSLLYTQIFIYNHLSLAETTSSNASWQNYFVPVNFLVFNFCDLVGRVAAHWVQWPGPTWSGSIITVILVMARLAFIPLLLFCNLR